MIKSKLKPCIICNQLCRWWSKKRCRACTIRESKYELKKSKINPISQKEKERKKIYMKLRKIYLREHPICERCNKNAAGEIHHKSSRIGDNLFKDFMGVCRECHIHIHSQHNESVEKGYIIPQI